MKKAHMIFFNLLSIFSFLFSSAFSTNYSRMAWWWDPKIVSVIVLMAEEPRCDGTQYQLQVVIDNKGRTDLKVEMWEIIRYKKQTKYIGPTIEIPFQNSHSYYSKNISYESFNCAEINSITYHVRLNKSGTGGVIYDDEEFQVDFSYKDEIADLISPNGGAVSSPINFDFEIAEEMKDCRLELRLSQDKNALWDLWNINVINKSIEYPDTYFELNEKLKPGIWYWGIRLPGLCVYLWPKHTGVLSFSVEDTIVPSSVKLINAYQNDDGRMVFSWDLTGSWDSNSYLKIYWRKAGGVFGDNLWAACWLGECVSKDILSLAETYTVSYRFSPGRILWGVEFRGADGKKVQSETGVYIIPTPVYPPSSENPLPVYEDTPTNTTIPNAQDPGTYLTKTPSVTVTKTRTPTLTPSNIIPGVNGAWMEVSARDPSNVNSTVAGATVTFRRHDNGALIFSGTTNSSGSVNFLIPYRPVYYDFSISLPSGSSCSNNSGNSVQGPGTSFYMWLQPGSGGSCIFGNDRPAANTPTKTSVPLPPTLTPTTNTSTVTLYAWGNGPFNEIVGYCSPPSHMTECLISSGYTCTMLWNYLGSSGPDVTFPTDPDFRGWDRDGGRGIYRSEVLNACPGYSWGF